MPLRRNRRHGAVPTLLIVLLSAPWFSPVHAGSQKASNRKATPPSSVRFIDAPSAESPAARQKRLKKECKGRPNAGACLGLTGRD